MTPFHLNRLVRGARPGRSTNRLSPEDARGLIRGPLRLLAPALALGLALCAPPAGAEEFRHGELEGSLDVTISHGVASRVGDRDKRLIGRANGGSANSVNADDGNLNYDGGPVSNASKFTGELELNYRNFGAFVRAHGFYDFENQRGERERSPLAPEAKDMVGRDLDVLDLYLTGALRVGGVPLEMRLGSHVLSWGESTFIQNGVNVINPFDVSKLRTPGAELRDGLVPVPMVSVSAALTDSLSVETFYQARWKKTEIDPPGSYFSTSDFAGAGARKAVLGWGGIPDAGFGFGPLTQAINADLAGFSVAHPALGAVALPQPAQAAFDADFLSVRRARDSEPDDSGQWGIALRYLAERLNNTEFGFYFINYHSRLPLVSARTGTAQGVAGGQRAAGAVAAPTSLTTRSISAAVAAAAPPGAPPALIQAQVQGQVSRIAGLLAVDRYVRTAGYFLEYPEDIQLLGVSFNTQLGASGWALQGEYSRRIDAPLQIDDVELLFAALTPVAADPVSGAPCRNTFSLYCRNQVGAFGPDAYIRGYIERDISQAQATLTKVFGPVIGASGLAFVAEAAFMHVHDMPNESELRLEGPGTATSGNPFHATAAGAHAGLEAEPSGRFATATSYGYRLAARLDYLNAIGAVNLYPRAQFQHDVEGVSPGPGGPFLEDRVALTLGLGASYLNRWQFDFSYTMYGGAGRYNQLNDRDFVSATIKYLF